MVIPFILAPDNEQPVKVNYNSDANIKKTKQTSPSIDEPHVKSGEENMFDPLSDLFSSSSQDSEPEKASLSVLGKEQNELLDDLQKESSKVSSNGVERSIFDELEKDYEK